MPTFHTPDGPRATGRSTDATRRHWHEIERAMPLAPRTFAAAGTPGPRRSPDVRRFHHDLYLDQRGRGFCVGFCVANALMTRLRIPPDATETAGDPLPQTPLSPLWLYDISRADAASEGWILGMGDGSVGSCCARGAAKWGVCDWDDDPAAPELVDAHRNDRPPSGAAAAFAMKHLVRSFALCDSFEHGLQLNAGGLPLVLCSEIPRAIFTTEPDGSFKMTGPPVSGHCYCLLDHDLDMDRAWVAMAWANWGERSDDPRYANRGGYTQVGTCSLTDLSDWFTPAELAVGSSEIIAFNVVDGFGPCICPMPSADAA